MKPSITSREMTYIPGPSIRKYPAGWVDAVLLGVFIIMIVVLVTAVKLLILDAALHPWKAEAAIDERYYCENLGSFRLTDEGDRGAVEEYCTALLGR